jgi:hypothetical protein
VQQRRFGFEADNCAFDLADIPFDALGQIFNQVFVKLKFRIYGLALN